MFKALRRLVVGGITAAWLLAGCSAEADPFAQDDAPLRVYATTGYLADAVQNIAPEAEVTTMVGPGGDPHTYQPSTRDIETLQNADIILWNGLYLEAQMIGLLEAQGERQVAAAEAVPEELLLSWPETDQHGNPLRDPHLWNSPDAWAVVVDEVTDKLVELDPDNAETYRTNAETYQQELAETADEVAELMATVEEPRILITGHDAFNLPATMRSTTSATRMTSRYMQLTLCLLKPP